MDLEKKQYDCPIFWIACGANVTEAIKIAKSFQQAQAQIRAELAALNAKWNGLIIPEVK